MSRKMARKIIVSVTNDLVTDQRVHKVCTSLQSFGYDVLLVGRLLPASPELLPRSYATKRMKLIFKRSFLFYAEYNLRLFLLLISRKATAQLSNDLDTLVANYIAARLTGRKLYYDSHEYFTEVPELVDRGFVRKFWENIESRILPKLKHTYTVSSAVAEAYRKKYGIDMKVVRNFPKRNVNGESGISRKNNGNRIVLYQGVVNVERGLEEAVSAMNYVENAKLLIIGRGDIDRELREQVKREKLEDKVEFLGVVPFEQLPAITASADLGLSIEKKVGLNYTYALPNKLFDYLQAGVPVLVSPLPEIKNVMDKYRVGAFIESHDPHHIAGKINKLLDDQAGRKVMKEEVRKAAEEYCWEREEETLRKIYEA